MPTGANAPDAKQADFLTVSVVVYQPDLLLFEKTLKSLERAIQRLQPHPTAVFIVQNCGTPGIEGIASRALPETRFQLISGHGNVGFGRGHNLVLPEAGTFHLVLNPDIEMAEEALEEALGFMNRHDECGALTPYATWPNGTRQFLCKRFPALFDLALRGFAPQILKRLFSRRLMRYQMSEETGDKVYWDPPIISGCFMVLRGDVYRALSGFDPRFFLYFEDFDLSLRAGKVTRLAYVPDVRIIHEGGHTARKGFHHVTLFAKSAIQFYRLHGFKLL